MAYKAIEDLPVWKAALRLAVQVFDLTAEGFLRTHAGFKDQLERAVVSISNNIAEGYERGSKAELLTFLYYARGSAGEVRSMLALLAAGREWADQRDEVESLSRLTFEISRQLGAWIESIKASDYEGHRAQTPEARQRSQNRARASAFLAELQQIQDEARSPSPNGSPPPDR